MALLKKSKLTSNKKYKKPTCMGDRWARELIDHYFSQRDKILAYRGKSAVDRRAVGFFEPLLLTTNWERWWHYYDKKYVDTVLWLLRRLKVGLRRKAEKELFTQFYERLPYHRTFPMNYNKNLVERLKKRWRGVK